ncbi:hypothetical protein IBD90_00845 [Francisella tularensis]|nr:hypothetical protein [Francisella tularensis]MBK2149457.1 hypothetical protein [Francisella tularensis]MBK2250584.1 hypothetical protein [Francisella tularensis]NDS80224.1 hypothetical protein [Francisella tularensis subsp. holarctica]NDT60234.1 hypothetical protein [Francisella tularensis subsp. holarctica]ORX29493.1 hypothetical protein ACC30_00800 [Francisella tularensis subsp. holarctica]
MKKTLTIALLGTIATTSVYADDLNAKIVNESVTKYSNNVETDADTNTNSPIYAFKSIAADASNIQANGEKLARGFVLTNNGAVKIPNSIKPKNMYMKDQATAAQGLEKYRAERDEINNNIKKLESQKKLGWRIKVVAEQAKLKSINTKIDILKGIENGDKAYAEEKIAQFNIVKNITVNGPKAYFNDIAKPVLSHLNAAWDSATSLNYVDYRSNIDMFWGARVVLWNGQYNINSKDAATAIEFNDITNYLTIQTIKSLQGSDTTKAVSLYADANTLTYTVTTIGDLSSVQKKIASPRTALSICEASLISIRTNTKVTTARNIINRLSNKKAVKPILRHLLNQTSIDDIILYDLDKLGDNWALKAATNAIRSTIGSDSILYVKGHTLMLISTSSMVDAFIKAIAENEIYKQVSDADRVLFGKNACNFTAAKNSNNPIVKAMIAASKQIAGQLPKGQVIDTVFEEKVYLALQSTMFENLSNVLPK